MIEQAVNIYRELTTALPFVFSDKYGDSLQNEAMTLAALGRESEAQAVLDQAATIRRPCHTTFAPIGKLSELRPPLRGSARYGRTPGANTAHGGAKRCRLDRSTKDYPAAQVHVVALAKRTHVHPLGRAR